MKRKAPTECRDIQDVRAQIDNLDAEVVSLLGERLGYIMAAATFKPDLASVRVPERIESMLKERRVWAEKHGISPDFVEKFYFELIEYSISEEGKRWKALHPNDADAQTSDETAAVEANR